MSCETINHPPHSPFGALGHWLRTFATYRAKRREHKVNRAAFSKMLSLDDNLLKDVGVSRNDVIWASQLPLSQNAAQELHRIALQKRTSF